MRFETDDLRINEIKEVIKPVALHQDLPLNDEASATVFHARQAIQQILRGEDDRLLVIVGPCSIHDPEAALEYAERLLAVREALKEDLHIVMRVYFEKPRTTVGWKGLINDPHLDGSFAINEGLHKARGLLLELAKRGMPAATEYLDLISPQYVADLISWGAIGARTTESQVHRELASGLSCPVGFKNGTDGGLQIAVDAMRSVARPHHFLSVTKEGHTAIFSTKGNPDCHIILRGGRQGPNYDAESVQAACRRLEENDLPPRLMVDCSHANSRKNPEFQPEVAEAIAAQIRSGSHNIVGVMMESHLLGGRQDQVAGQALVYGQSITDGCLAWDTTVPTLENLAAAIRQRRAAQAAE